MNDLVTGMLIEWWSVVEVRGVLRAHGFRFVRWEVL